MAKKVEVEIEVNSNVDASVKQLQELRKQLKLTAAGSEDFKKLSNQIKDVEDALEESKAGAKSFKDQLEEAPGPIGGIFQGMRKLEIATKSFGTAFKAIGIGLLVSLVAGLAAAFTQTEETGKKLQPLFQGFQKILNGVFRALQPVFDTLVNLAIEALPIVTDAFQVVYSAMTSFLQGLGLIASAVGKLIKGDFSGAWEDASSAVTGFSDRYDDASNRFIEGTKEMTNVEKEELEKQREAQQKALEERIKRMELEDKMDKAKMDKLKAEALALAKTEQEKLDIEKKFFEMASKARMKDLTDKEKLYAKDSEEYKNIQVEKIAAETEYINGLNDLAQKQKDLNAKNNKELAEQELQALSLKKAQGLVGEEEYQKQLYNIKVKYAADAKELTDAEIEYQQFLTDQRKKNIETERQLLFQGLQNQIDVLEKKNAEFEMDFQMDVERLNQRKVLLEQQRDIELQAAENDQIKQLEIRKKYGEAIAKVESDITNSIRAEQDARIAITAAYIDIVAQFGGLLGQIAGQNKQLQKAGLIIEQAAAVARIVQNTVVANTKAIAASPLTAGMPWVGINTATAALGIANAVAATAKGISQINSQNTNTETIQTPSTSSGRNYAVGGLINGPRHAQGGVMIEAEGGEAVMTRGAVTMFAPLLSAMNQMGGGTPFNSNLNVAPSDRPTLANPSESDKTFIIKSYVVERDLTTEQEKQARLKDLSTL
jgi:hypothetical protein